MSTNPIPVELRELLVKLNYLSMIPSSSKLNTNTMSFVKSDSFLGSFLRKYYHEDRNVSLEFIKQTIITTIKLINDYSKTDFLKILINSLSTARLGISELLTTYREDPKMIANIQVCIDEIDIQLNKHKSLIKGNESIYTDNKPSNIQKN